MDRKNVFVSGGKVRVEVENPGRGFVAPEDPGPEPDQVSGWGLFLVGKMADRWKVESRYYSNANLRGRYTTLVWFELEDAVG